MMSTLPRLYVDSGLKSGKGFALSEGQSHYLMRVLRLGLGAEMRLFNGRDGEWLAVVDEVRGRRVFAMAQKQLHVQPEARPGPRLLFAPLKKTRTDFAVEKATELGAAIIQPVLTDRTQTRTVRLDRLRVQALEAAEQTERFDLPRIDEAESLNAALGEWPADLPLVFCDEEGDARPIMDALRALKGKGQGGGILIGPEGGFTPEERMMLRSRDFVIPVTLGPRILRAETAIVSALTIWQAVLGDWC